MSRLFVALASLTVCACALDYDQFSTPGQTGEGGTDGGSGGDVQSGGGPAGSGGTAASGAVGAMGGSGGAGNTGNAAGSGGGGALYASCAALLAAEPGTTDGVYMVDVDGDAGEMPPFDVVCDMSTDGGGWTLVGFEEANVGDTMARLGVESGNPSALVAGTSAFIGPRFAGTYQEAKLIWDGEELTFSPAEEMFVDTVSKEIAINAFATSDASLSGWITQAGGAELCRATAAGDFPGDTSWAIKPQTDDNQDCGCNDMSWQGRGAFYTGNVNCTSCDCWGPGGFVGVKDHGEPKAGLVGYDTALWIR